MKTNLKMIPYLLFNIMAFYLLPMIIQDTGSAMFVLLVAIPFICFAAAIVFGIFNAFNWMYPLSVALLFVPTIFIYYNESAAFYITVYGIIAFLGNLIGLIFYKLKRTK
ncbi:MAG: hypothetical protein RR951_07695 [Ruthenibacterium sp.]